MRTGVLFRSGHLADAAPQDLERIAALGLSVIVDLRWSAERQRHPTRHRTNECRIISTDLRGGDDPWRAFLRSADLSARSIRDFIIGVYRGMPFKPWYIDLFSRLFEALATISGAVLVHCSAGKDRTRLIVALAHWLLGLHRDDIFVDYLLTNRFRSFESHGAAVASTIAEAAGRVPDEAIVRAAMEVDAAYLEAAFQAVEAECGSVDAYLKTVLSVSPVVRDAILNRLALDD